MLAFWDRWGVWRGSYGEGSRWGSFCLSVSLPVCSPQFIPAVALRTLHSSLRTLTPTSLLSGLNAPQPKPSHMCSLEGHRTGDTPETENHLCMYECLYTTAHTWTGPPTPNAHTHTDSSSAQHKLHAFVRNWDYDSPLCLHPEDYCRWSWLCWCLGPTHSIYCRLDAIIYMESQDWLVSRKYYDETPHWILCCGV